VVFANRYTDALQFGHGGEAVEDMARPTKKSALAQLQFGHGGEAVEDAEIEGGRNVTKLGFNSATAVKPWKTAEKATGGKASNKLQFGHGGEAVEDLTCAAFVGGPCEASIRPRR